MFDIQSHCEIRPFVKPSKHLKADGDIKTYGVQNGSAESSRVFHLINADEVQPADRVDTRHVGHIGDVNGNS